MADETGKVLEDRLAPHGAGFGDVFLDHLPQVAPIGFHDLGIDTMNLDQLVVVLVDEGAIFVEHVREPAGHARSEVDAGLAEHRDQAAGHVFAQ